MPKNILIVEDEALLADALRTVIESMGYKALVAGNGEQAEKQLSQNFIDLILLDLLMPVKDGFEFLKDLRTNENYKHIKVIILTNYEKETKKKELLNFGISDYIVKSEFNLNDIRFLIDKHMQ